MKYAYDAFLSYAREDIAAARQIRDRLVAAGARVFFDKTTLGAGDHWKLVISQAIRRSKTFIVFLSRVSVRKAGYVQYEIREALEVARSLPPGRVFVIPLRLEPCKPKHPMLDEFTRVDLFDGFEEAVIRLVKAVKPKAARLLEAANVERIAPPPRAIRHTINSPFAGTLAALPSDEIGDVKKRLDLLRQLSGVTAMAVANLYAEPHLPQPTLAAVIRAIQNSPLDGAELQHALTQVARQHVLEGPPARLKRGAPLLRVISLDTLAHLLLESGLVASLAAAYALVKHIVQDEGTVRPRMMGVPLGRYLVWAVATVPGEAMPLPTTIRRDAVIDILGLPRHRAGEPLLAINYRLPKSLTPHVPTFCDAYASSVWPYLFRPAAEGELFGRTVPRDAEDGTVGVPEVVHAPFTLDRAHSIRVLA